MSEHYEHTPDELYLVSPIMDATLNNILELYRLAKRGKISDGSAIHCLRRIHQEAAQGLNLQLSLLEELGE